MRAAAARSRDERARPGAPAQAPGPAALLALHRAAGNAAVASLFVQRVRYERVDRDDVAERFRLDSATPAADRDIAVAYVANAGSDAVTARPPEWSTADGGNDSTRHAERLVLASALAAGFRYDVPPADTSTARVVSLFTELLPCGSCGPWLDENAWPQLPVRWTAPAATPNAAAPRWLAKRLWLTRNEVLAQLKPLRAGLYYTFDDVFRGRVDDLWREIVTLALDPTSGAAHVTDARAALAFDQQWRARAASLTRSSAEFDDDAAGVGASART